MKKILAFIFILLVFQNAQAEKQKLSQAYEQGLLERVRNVFSLEAPEEKVERPICATPIFVEINFNKHRFSAKTARLLKPYISRPDFGENTEDTFNSPDGHFKIHYTRTGEDAVFDADVDVNPPDGVPDYVNCCADIFDYVWVKEVYGLKYDPPPKDDWYQPNGGDGRYDIYLKNIDPLFLGYTAPESSLVARPISYTSYIVVRNDYTGCVHEDNLDCLRATAAHEFFHAVQFGYDATELEYIELPDDIQIKPYWMEMTAVWMEEMVYDDVNDYLGYLRDFFNEPWLSLKTFRSKTDLHPYGSCVWPMYLQERFDDTTIIKEIWEGCGKVRGNNAIDCPDCPGGKSATDLGLEARGSTFEEAFREFTVWNYFTGDRARTKLFYSEGDLFPQVKVGDLHYHTTYPVYSPSGPNHPYGLGSNYIIFKPEEKQGGVKLSFSPASEEYDYEISAVGYNKEVNEPVSHEFQINHQTGSAEADVYDWIFYNEIIMIPAAVSRDGDSYFPYTYSAVFDSSYHGEYPFPEKDWVGQNFPNPFVIKSSFDSTYFPFILSSVSEVKIDVFTVSGELIWDYPPPEKEGEEWTIGDYTERGRCPAWDGRNQKGKYVTSGIYIYQVRTKNSTVIKKMAVIR